jgi:hypothetical protein
MTDKAEVLNKNINWDKVLDMLNARVHSHEIIGMSDSGIRQYLIYNQPSLDT